MLLLAQSDLTIVISWGAVITLLGVIVGYVGSIGILYWKFFGHASNSDVHVNKNVHIVSRETCEATSTAIKDALERVVKSTDILSTKIDTNNTLLLQFVSDKK